MNDAWRLAPWADVLYACDALWWEHSAPKPGEFAGEKWSTHSLSPRHANDKRAAAAAHNLNLIPGRDADGFSLTPEAIHYGLNSGFQAINLAILFGATRIWLIGFDMAVNGKRHFFGEHPAAIREKKGDCTYSHFIGAFDTAARMLPPDIEIINASPGSALQCFERGTI